MEVAQLVGCGVDVSPAYAGVEAECPLSSAASGRRPRARGGSHGPAADAVLGRDLVRAPGPVTKTSADLAESSPSAAQCPRC